jgi:hypothetical protein
MDGGRVVGQTVATVSPAGADAPPVLVVDGSLAGADDVRRTLEGQGHRAVAVLPDAAGAESLLAALGASPGSAAARPEG